MIQDDRTARAHRSADGVRALGLDPHDAYRRQRAAKRQRDPGDEAAATDGNDHELNVG